MGQKKFNNLKYLMDNETTKKDKEIYLSYLISMIKITYLKSNQESKT